VKGTSMDGQARIYYVLKGKKLWVQSPDAFEEQGWRFEDVVSLPDADLDAIPTSDEVVGCAMQIEPTGEPVAGDAFEARDEARARLASPFLVGAGIEVGAGLNPQKLPDGARAELFELRAPAEMALMFNADEASFPTFQTLDTIHERFPDGADFLVAHNVIEHCADPIATLLEWVSYVRDEGVLVLSVPCAEFCPDKGRVIPPVEHLVFDYLFSRSMDSFESREHSYSCTLGWMNTWEDWLALDKQRVSQRAHDRAHAKDLDVHWHAFDPKLFDGLLQAASHFGPRRLHPLAWGDPYQEPPMPMPMPTPKTTTGSTVFDRAIGATRRIWSAPDSPQNQATKGDIIGIFRVGGASRPGDTDYRWRDWPETLRAIEQSMNQARSRLTSNR
jgi:SAM-dependent methyltransferase